MNSRIENQIDDLVENGYEFEFGDYISKGWRLLSDNAGTFLVYTFAAFIISFICLIIPIIGWLALIFVVGPALYAGYFHMAKQADQEGNVQVSTGFKGFQQLGKIIPVWLMIMIIMVLTYLPYGLAVGPEMYGWWRDFMDSPQDMLGTQPPSAGWFGLLSLIPYYFQVAYLFAIPLVIFRDMDAWDAMEASRKIITKKWFLFFVLYLLSSMMAGVGVLLLFLGLFFTITLAFTPIYAAFEDIVGVEDSYDDEDDLDHLIV